MNGQLARRELFLQRLPSGSIGIAASLSPETAYKEQWMGIYYQGEKVGYSSTTINRLSGKESPGYIILNRIFMMVNLLDNPVKVYFEGVLRTDKEFRMRNFSSRLRSAGHEIKLDGALDGDTLTLSVVTGNKVFRKRTTVGEDVNLSNSLTPMLFMPALKLGVTYSVDILDPLTLATSTAKITIKDMEPLEYGGKPIDTYVVEAQYQGITYTSWVTEGGEVLKEETPLGWTLVREDRDVASDFRAEANRFSHDIARLIAVPADMPITDPEETRGLEVVVDGIDLKNFTPEGAGQHVVDAGRGLIKITVEPFDAAQSISIPVKDDAFKEFLASTLLVQSDDENIRKRALQIAGDEDNALIVAERINRWLFTNIRKQITFSLPSAVEVLESREGDCNEHTTLFVALARSIGIPSKIAIGLVYYKGLFYYHAWPEVYVGRWVAMDPTLGQSPADATHVKLLEGELDQQAKLMQAIGNIKFSIKSISYGPQEAEGTTS
jgi:hypothetical protein